MTDISIKEPIRWLHLSDFHVGKDDYAQRKLFNEIITHVRDVVSQGFTPDLLFITGDIANKGLLDEYSVFTTEFLDPLQQIFHGGLKNLTFMVPGNHDVNREINKYFSREEIYRSETKFFDPTPKGLKERQQFISRLEAYSNIPEIVPQNWLSAEAGYYSNKIRIKDVEIGVIGINTAWLSKDDSDRHDLSPGIEMLDDALNNLTDCDIKIVLGHHPVDWFRDEHVSPIQAILGKHHAIYLHGHLHRARVTLEDGAGHGYLSVQSGAAFQTGDNEVWVNGILWGELDTHNAVLRLQPREWNPKNRDWRLGKDLPELRRIVGSDWWAIPLPKPSSDSTSVNSTASEEPFRYPEGWQLIDTVFLRRHQEPISKDHALRYFDGATPDWRVALSPTIPSLSVVGRVLRRLASYGGTDKPQVVQIIGPTGEGKSTALMQITTQVVEAHRGWNVLWRTSDNTLSVEEVLRLPQTGNPWLMVCDAADLIAHDLYRLCQLLAREQRTDIRLLIACRETDWLAAKAHRFEWLNCSSFQQDLVSGLTDEDASSLVEAWTAFGDEALGHLSNFDQEIAVKRLYGAARQGAANEEGSLLGALLKERYGDDLKEHIKTMLNRLNDRTIPGGSDLLSAFSYIAAMHVEGLDFLSRPVLADALACPIEKLNTQVLTVLGMEAAVSSDGRFILTRHKRIAHATLSLLQDVFEVDVDEMYLELVEAAHRQQRLGTYVPHLNNWYYRITDHFIAKGKDELALKIGELLLRLNPHRLTFRRRLSSINRRLGRKTVAANLFANIGKVEDRATLMEWGFAESVGSISSFGVLIMALSISDNASSEFITVDNAKMALNGIGISCLPLHEEYLERAFMKTVIATAELVLILPLGEKIQTSVVERLKAAGKEPGESIDVGVELTVLRDSIETIWNFSGSQVNRLQDYVTSPTDFKFDGLLRLLNNAVKQKPSAQQ
jgi:predicted phosphodiesterase